MTTPRNDPNQVPDPSAYLPQSHASIAPPLDGSQPGGVPAAGNVAPTPPSYSQPPYGQPSYGQPADAYPPPGRPEGQQPSAPPGQGPFAPPGQPSSYPGLPTGQPHQGQVPYPGQAPYGQAGYPGAPDRQYPGAPYPGQPGQQGQSGPPYPGQPYPGQQPYDASGPPYSPPQGQPYAYPPPGYPAMGQPGIQDPPPPVKRKRTGRLIGALVAVVLIAGGGIYSFVRAQSAPQNAQPGDCIQYVSESDNGVVDCNSPKAQYRVEARIENKSSTTGCDAVDDADVTLYSMEDTKNPFTLCVSLVLHDGSCVSSEGDVVDCSKPDVIAKVTSIHEGTSDPSVCAPGELPRPYTTHPRVVCLEQLN